MSKDGGPQLRTEAGEYYTSTLNLYQEVIQQEWDRLRAKNDDDHDYFGFYWNHLDDEPGRKILIEFFEELKHELPSREAAA